MSTLNIAYGSYTALTVTNLQSLANDATSPFGAWQSARVDNQSSVKADDFEVVISLPMANTAPANDQAVYVYVIPWVTTDGGTTWIPGANLGTTTAPTGSEGTASIVDPNAMRVVTLPYPTQNMTVNGYLSIAALFGGLVPDAWSVAIRNCSGAALSTSCVVSYRAVTYTQA